jgi:hypothetical protein
MKKILLILCMFIMSAANAGTVEDCLNNISKTKEWKDGITNIFGKTDLNDENVSYHKPQIYTLLAQEIGLVCGEKLTAIAKAKSDRGIIYFSHNSKEYGFDFSISEMFDNIMIRTGVLVINKRNLSPNKVLKLSDIPKKKKFFSDECSDWTIWDNLDDDAAVNVAGQAVFNEYGGAKNEFFLDFAEGDNRRAFPGLVLMDKTWSTQESIVTYMNLKTGIKKVQQFAEKLKGSQCSNQGLAVYLVALDVSKDSATARRGAMAAAGAIGVTAGAIAVKTAGAAAGTAAATGAAATGAAAGTAAAATGAAATGAAAGTAAATGAAATGAAAGTAAAATGAAATGAAAGTAAAATGAAAGTAAAATGAAATGAAAGTAAAATGAAATGAAAGTAAATGAAATGAAAGTTAAAATGASFLGIPVVGWIIGGVVIATVYTIAMIPSEIENLQQVMILDGPYNL